MTVKIKNTGIPFELLVKSIFHAFGFSEDSVVHNEIREGITAKGTKRQIDLLIKGNISMIPVQIAVECKDYAKPLTIEKIDAFAKKIQEVGVNFGIMITRKGFQKTLIEYASNSNIQLMEVIELTEGSCGYILPFPRTLSISFSSSSSGNRPNIPLKREHRIYRLVDGDFTEEELIIHLWKTGRVPRKEGKHEVNLGPIKISFFDDLKNYSYIDAICVVGVDKKYIKSKISSQGLRRIEPDGKRQESLCYSGNIEEILENGIELASIEELRSECTIVLNII